MTALLSDGQKTGLSDSNGRVIVIGDRVRKASTCGQHIHGDWSIFRVIARGVVPILIYLESEKGQVLPEGFLAAPLADEYDRKMFCFVTDISTLRPMDKMVVIDELGRDMVVIDELGDIDGI